MDEIYSLNFDCLKYFFKKPGFTKRLKYIESIIQFKKHTLAPSIDEILITFG